MSATLQQARDRLLPDSHALDRSSGRFARHAPGNANSLAEGMFDDQPQESSGSDREQRVDAFRRIGDPTDGSGAVANASWRLLGSVDDSPTLQASKSPTEIPDVGVERLDDGLHVPR